MRLPILASLLAVSVLAAACRARSGAPEYLRSVEAAEAPMERAWKAFEGAVARRDGPAAREGALAVVAAASRARDALETLRVAPPFTTALREELVFLNHVIPAFRRFADSDGGPASLADLRDILRRGRTHQRRGRETLAVPRSRWPPESTRGRSGSESARGAR